jgi:hypothetical protein
MARISKTQTYAILWLNSQSYDNSYIEKELNVTNKQIETVLDKIKTTEEPEPTNSIKTSSSPVGQSRSKNLMITESASRTRSVAIMTKEASELNDVLKKNSQPPSKSENGIFRPFNK